MVWTKTESGWERVKIDFGGMIRSSGLDVCEFSFAKQGSLDVGPAPDESGVTIPVGMRFQCYDAYMRYLSEDKERPDFEQIKKFYKDVVVPEKMRRLKSKKARVEKIPFDFTSMVVKYDSCESDFEKQASLDVGPSPGESSVAIPDGMRFKCYDAYMRYLADDKDRRDFEQRKKFYADIEVPEGMRFESYEHHMNYLKSRKLMFEIFRAEIGPADDPRVKIARLRRRVLDYKSCIYAVPEHYFAIKRYIDDLSMRYIGVKPNH